MEALNQLLAASIPVLQTLTVSGRETRLRRREERSEWLRGEEYEWKEEKEKKKRDSRSG